MRIRTSMLMLGMLVAGVVPAQQTVAKPSAENKLAQAPLASTLPEPVTSAVARGDYAKVQSELVKQLQQQKPGLENKQSLHLAMLLELIRETGAGVMSDFAAADKAQKKFLETLVKDAEWLELYLTCGLVPHQKAAGLEVLYRIWQEENGEVQNKALAVALASCWGGGETWPDPAIAAELPGKFNPVRRYKFFQRQEARGLLHPNYRNLRAWELRFVVANPGQDWDDDSYEFAAKAINLPWDKYQIACWSATYTGTSRFGDTVQGGAYNLPYADESSAETTLLNGGVCGAMSHLGAVAAMAHGIPAYTCGQPGHCAYAVRPERGKWIGGFGGPDGYMHNMIFGHRAPTSSNLMEAVFADDAKVARAYRLSFCARALESAGDAAGAEKMWRAVLKESPLHPFFRAALHALLVKRDASADECYKYLIEEMLPEYDGHGVAALEASEDLLAAHPSLDEQKKLAVYRMLHQVLSSTPASVTVTIDDMVQKQVDSLTRVTSRQRFLEDAFAAHMQRGDGTIFGQLLEWVVKSYVRTEEESLIFRRAFARAAEVVGGNAASGDEGGDDSRALKIAGAYDKAIIAAELARSAPAFEALTQGALTLQKSAPQPRILEKMGELAGKPAEAVLFRISSTCRYDTPAFHAGIMTPLGGRCHSGKEQRPTFITELKEVSHVSGCVIRKTDGNEGRMKKAIVSTSEDGATWFPRAEIANMPKEWVAQFPEGIRARWIRLEFVNEQPDFAHISHFVTFSR